MLECPPSLSVQQSTLTTTMANRRSRVTFAPHLDTVKKVSGVQIPRRLELNTEKFANTLHDNFVPIDDLKTMIELHKLNKSPQWVIDKLVNDHETFYKTHNRPITNDENNPLGDFPEHPDDPIRKGDGTVDEPFKELTEKYLRKCETPPADVLIDFMKRYGYSEWKINETIRKQEELQKDMEDQKNILLDYFAKHGSSKPAKSKSSSRIRKEKKKFYKDRVNNEDS